MHSYQPTNEPAPAQVDQAQDTPHPIDRHVDRVNALFPVADDLPAHVAKRLLQQRPKRPAWNAKFGGATKVVRDPLDGDRDELVERIELLHSALLTAEEEIHAAQQRSSAGASNRFEKLAGFVAEIRIPPSGPALLGYWRYTPRGQ